MSRDPMESEDTIKKSKHVPRPDQDAFKKQMDKLSSEIESMQKKLNDVRESMKGGNGKKGDPKRTELRNQLAEVRKQQGEIKSTRQRLLDQVKDVTNNMKKKQEDVKQQREKTPYKSVQEIDAQIRKLESQIESGGIKLVEEKRMIQEVSNLRRIRKTVESFGGHQESIDNDKKKLDQLRKQLDEMEPKRKTLEASYTEIQDKLNDMDKEKDAEFAKRNDVVALRTQLQKDLDDLFNQKRELNEKFRKQREDFQKHLQEERVRRQEEMKKRRQEQEAERLEAEAQKERELAEVPAFSDEINIASNLITFFQQMTGKEIVKETVVETSKEEVSVDGAKVLKSKSQRLEEDAFFVGKSANKKKAKETKAKTNFKLDLSILDALWKLKLDVPSGLEEVDGTIKALEEKKTRWISEQADATAEAKRKAEEKIAALRAKAAKVAEEEPTTDE